MPLTINQGKGNRSSPLEATVILSGGRVVLLTLFPLSLRALLNRISLADFSNNPSHWVLGRVQTQPAPPTASDFSYINTAHWASKLLCGDS